MKKIKVKPIFGAHQIYQEIANYPPENVEYAGISKDTSEGKYYENKKWKERINRWMQKFAFPRMIPIKPGDYDLIHSSRGIIPLQFFGNKPWVMDIEQFTSFIGLHFDLMVKNKFLRGIVQNRLRSKNCKAILCHCEATRQSFLKYLNCRGFEHKLKVLYPSSHIVKIEKKKNNKKITFLSILSLFEQKGGIQILEAFSILEKKYKNIELIMRADVPQKLKEKYNSKNIVYQGYFKEIIPREELLKKVYSQGDVFIYTTFCDSFGFSLIDALVAGLPIITTNLFASPEVIENGKNGFVITIPGYKPEDYIQEYNIKKMNESNNEKFIEDLVFSMEKLIKNKKLRENMGKESFNLISEGKFSLKERNKKLRKVYEEALKWGS